MRPMWERRLLTALIVIGISAFGAMLDVRGFGVFVYIGASVALAMILGFLFEARLQARQSARLR
jgi:hypothetical protein